MFRILRHHFLVSLATEETENVWKLHNIEILLWKSTIHEYPGNAGEPSNFYKQKLVFPLCKVCHVYRFLAL